MGHRLEFLDETTNTWQDLFADTLATHPISWEGGMDGSDPLNVVAAPGKMAFGLNNSASNSAQTRGWYSPGGGDVRPGFRHGAEVRLFAASGREFFAAGLTATASQSVAEANTLNTLTITATEAGTASNGITVTIGGGVVPFDFGVGRDGDAWRLLVHPSTLGDSGFTAAEAAAEWNAELAADAAPFRVTITGNTTLFLPTAQGLRADPWVLAGGTEPIYRDTGRWVFRGRVSTIHPVPGQFGAQRTDVVCTDWMAELLGVDDVRLRLIEGGTWDDGLTELLGAVERQPGAVSFEPGLTPMQFLFDDAAGRSDSATAIAQRLALAEGGRIFLTGTETQDELLVGQNLESRSGTASVLTVTDTDIRSLTVPSDLDRIVNEVHTEIYPHRVETATVALGTLQGAITVPGTETVEALVEFRDDAQAISTGGRNVQAPTHGTDFAVTSTAGVAMPAADVEVTAEVFGASALVRMRNRTATPRVVAGVGETPGLAVRGQRIYRFAPVLTTVADAASVAEHGRRQVGAPIQQPYHDTPGPSSAQAAIIVDAYSQVGNTPTEVVLRSETPEALQRFLPIEIGDRVTIAEPVTGWLGDVFVQRVRGTIRPGIVSLSWTLAPAGGVVTGGGFFTLDSPTQGILDASRLGI